MRRTASSGSSTLVTGQRTNNICVETCGWCRPGPSWETSWGCPTGQAMRRTDFSGFSTLVTGQKNCLFFKLFLNYCNNSFFYSIKFHDDLNKVLAEKENTFILQKLWQIRRILPQKTWIKCRCHKWDTNQTSRRNFRRIKISFAVSEVQISAKFLFVILKLFVTIQKLYEYCSVLEPFYDLSCLHKQRKVILV